MVDCSVDWWIVLFNFNFVPLRRLIGLVSSASTRPNAASAAIVAEHSHVSRDGWLPAAGLRACGSAYQ